MSFDYRVQLSIFASIAFVAADFLLAYSTASIEYFGILHETYSYQLTTVVRLMVAKVEGGGGRWGQGGVMWKVGSWKVGSDLVICYEP